VASKNLCVADGRPEHGVRHENVVEPFQVDVVVAGKVLVLAVGARYVFFDGALCKTNNPKTF
jgi:hypothetical protein